MNYLARPVFKWAIDWASSVERSISYNPNETALGFGAEYFLPTQEHTVHGWSFKVQLVSSAEISAVDAFTAALYGRLHGFWLPVPFEAMDIVAGVAGNQFDINACGLTQTWQDRPDFHLVFIVPGSDDWQAAQIINVTDNGDGTERVTLDADIDPVPTLETIVRRLHYVRLIDDAESATFEAEGWQTRPLNVIELPLEYNLAETGRQPIYLYHFWAAAPVLKHWYYTSFAADVWSNGNKYLKFPITHGEVTQTARGDLDELQIQAKPDPTHPLSFFFPQPFGAVLNVELKVCSLQDPDTARLLFKGVVQSVKDAGTTYEASCASPFVALDRKVPRMLVEPPCNHCLYGAACGVRRADFATMVVIHAIDADPVYPKVIVEMAYPTQHPERPRKVNWFAGGIFENGLGLRYEPRTIVGSTWDGENELLVLSLNLPLIKAEVGDRAEVVPGCDLTAETCEKKFNNFNRFGGFIAVPQRNLTLQAFNNQPVSQGGKK